MRNFIIVTAFLVSCSYAQSLSFLSGSEADTKGQSYSYVGLMAEKSVNSKTSLLAKFWGDYLVYKFEQNGTNVRAEAPAFQLSGGVKRRYNAWSFTLWAGWERRDTDVSPDVPGVEVKGTKDSLLAQIEAYGNLGKGYGADFIASYSSSTSYLWSRARLKKELNRSLNVGGEVVGQGNKDYSAVQSGLIVELKFYGLSLGFRGGYKNSSKGDSAYTGVELYWGF